MIRPLVSVIIPVYNAEQYLRQCLDSVISQSYSQLEVLVVEDGSNDTSARICDEYSAKDERVKVYHQKNQGQAVARNFGTNISKGEYIIYVDSDDVIAVNHVERLLDIGIKYNADIVQCEYLKFRKNIIPRVREKIVMEYSAAHALEEFCYQRIFNASPWGKLIKRDLLIDLRFPAGTGYEDYAIMYQLIGNAIKLVYTNEELYYYRQHALSTMHAAFSKKKIDRIKIAYNLKEYVTNNYPEKSIAVNSRVLLANFQLLMDLPFKKEYMYIKEEVWKNVKSVRRTVICDGNAKKSLRMMAIISYLGVNVLMVLGRVYKKIYYAF